MEVTNYLWVFFISMVPVVELRGAIPVAAGLGINPAIAYFICVIGNMLPVPFILLLVRPVFEWLKRLPALRGWIRLLEERAYKRSVSMTKCSFWALAIFVGIPLPGTGAWTGALIAALLGMRFGYAMLAIFAGVIAAGALVTLITTGVFVGADLLREVFFINMHIVP